MLTNKYRPIIGGFKTIAIILVLKIFFKTKITGWKYYFASINNFRIDRGLICLSGNNWIESGSLLNVFNNGKIILGERTFINKNSIIISMNNIEIGDDVLIADHVSIYDHDHDILNKKIYRTNPVVIKNNVWVGSHSVILKGVVIGENSVIAAGSIVVKSIPSNQVWGGVPAKFIKEIDS